MYDVKGALDVCIEKYGSLEGLKRHKVRHVQRVMFCCPMCFGHIVDLHIYPVP